MTAESVPSGDIARALRGVRPAAYRIGETGDRTTLALVMAASEAGRRNAAERLVRSLAAAGLGLAAEDPVATLTGSHAGIPVTRVQP